jgi:predicted DCC family thiol-disulfide oxidoreductase YuxK
MKKKHIILFDGVCNFCNDSVNFIIDRDSGATFSFAPLQSESGQEILAANNLATKDFDSIVLVMGNKVYQKSRAALEIARRLSGLWPLAYIFVVVPAFIRDFIYDIVAKNRYKWFGKQDECRLPTPDIRARFLETN